MKREDLRTKLTEEGIPEEKQNGLIDYIMSANGADVNSLKSENEALKSKYAEDMKAKDDQLKAYEDKVKGFGDYEELKQFKADTEANAEKSKRVEFLKSQGCKYPDLIMSQLDFDKAEYDETKKTYTGLDEQIKGFKNTHKDLFEVKGTQEVVVDQTPNPTGSEFYERYRKENPNLKFD